MEQVVPSTYRVSILLSVLKINPYLLGQLDNGIVEIFIVVDDTFFAGFLVRGRQIGGSRRSPRPGRRELGESSQREWMGIDLRSRPWA